ncbi:unnamed protein product [Sphenostylis stenocarpa]|uniref:Transmembrane protein n=1 Tax=Sphenostylis stenocarpa TaxID=92480 RepID=A0AA86TM32_9FABA|nr:unnamed protein product [Sphenostylis stenocarpa]
MDFYIMFLVGMGSKVVSIIRTKYVKKDRLSTSFDGSIFSVSVSLKKALLLLLPSEYGKGKVKKKNKRHLKPLKHSQDDDALKPHPHPNRPTHSSIRSLSMAVSDAVVSNLTVLYVAVIACIKAYGFVCGRSFGGAFVLLVSTATVALILVATLTWDVSRKATYAFAPDHPPPPYPPPHHAHEPCKGGICWHGVAVRSPASQVRFRLPPNLPHTTL